MGAARRLTILTLVIATLTALSVGYGRFHRKAQEQIVQAAGDLHDLTSKMHALNSALSSVQRIRTVEVGGWDRLRHLYDAEDRSRKAMQDLIASINQFVEHGAMHTLFPSDTSMAKALNDLREWLTDVAGEPHPFASNAKDIDQRLETLAAHLEMYTGCLGVPTFQLDELRRDVGGCLDARRRSLDPLR